MKKPSRSYEIALSAIACAFAVMALTLGSYVQVLLAGSYVLAAVAFMLPLYKDFVWGYVLGFVATVLLSFLFTGFVVGLWRLLPYVMFFGLHPLANYLQKKYVHRPWLHAIVYFVKAAWFVLTLWFTLVYVLIPFFGVDRLAWYRAIEPYLYWVLFLGGAVVFIGYDCLIVLCQRSVNAVMRRIGR